MLFSDFAQNQAFFRSPDRPLGSKVGRRQAGIRESVS
jgi:hypothetical protein